MTDGHAHLCKLENTKGSCKPSFRSFFNCVATSDTFHDSKYNTLSARRQRGHAAHRCSWRLRFRGEHGVQPHVFQRRLKTHMDHVLFLAKYVL